MSTETLITAGPGPIAFLIMVNILLLCDLHSVDFDLVTDPDYRARYY